MSYKDRCRVCLMGGAEYKIFENSKHSIHSKFLECFKENIENVEGYPVNICQSCKTTLDIVYKFVSKYKSNSKILESGRTVVKEEVDIEDEMLEGPFELDFYKNETLSDCDDWAFLEPQVPKPDISLTEIKIKLENLKEIVIKKEPVQKSPCKTSRVVLSVLEDWNGERSENSKEITKKSMQNLQLSLPVYEREKLCDLCGEVFGNLAKHKSSKHNKIYIKCTMCPRVLSGERGIKRHMEAVHNDKPFVCEICGKSFGVKRVLENHMKGVHLKIKKNIKYPCDKCDKVYISRLGLKVHDRNVHTGLRPAVCEECGKSFVCESYLREHQRLHTGETPYKCPVCGRGYAQKGNMRSHMKHNHRLADLSPELLKTKPSWLKYLKKP